MLRFLVEPEQLGASPLRLRGAAYRHLRQVLRLGPGATVELFDGCGRTVLAEVVGITPGAAELRILREVETRREPSLPVILAVAVSKGAKVDWVVEKATELGVTAIRPFTSERTVPEGPGVGRRADRWRRIARAASAQSGRSRVPEVAEPTTLDDVVRPEAREGAPGFLFDPSGDSVESAAAAVPDPPALLVVTGPEGGFTEDELGTARDGGVRIVSSGPRILRAETAAIVAVTLCQHRWGDLG